MLCIYRSKANFAENMANNVKKRVKVPASTPKRKQRMVCLMSEEEVRIVDCYLKKYKITNKARWLRETVLTFIHQKMDSLIASLSGSAGPQNFRMLSRTRSGFSI